MKFEHIDDKDEESYDSSLVQFLVDRATSNPVLGTYLHWYVMVECQDKNYGKMYAKVAYHFFSELLEVSLQGLICSRSLTDVAMFPGTKWIF